MSYQEFLNQKVAIAEKIGFDCNPNECHNFLKPHQKDMVAWAVRGGRRAIFTAFGLGKTVIQLEIARLVLQKSGHANALIVLPLNVKQEFIRDAAKVDISVKFIRSCSEMEGDGIYLTNYESVRDGKIDTSVFSVVLLDEASCLRGFGGTKTFREFMAVLAGDDRRDMSNPVQGDGIPYRFVATATPSPNEFIELLAYSAFLGVMDVGGAKTRFFKRNSEKADELTIHPHKEREFWLWVSSWAIFVQKPSDLGYSDDGYELPPLDIRWHEVESDHSTAGVDHQGQNILFKNGSLGVIGASREKRESLGSRIEKLLEIRAENPKAHRILWHDLESERMAIEKVCKGVISVYGSQDSESREQAIIDFSDGKVQELAGKPVMLGSGCNFQRYCSWAIFLGIGFKFNDFIQAVHRLHRFLQTGTVRIDLIYTEAERSVRAELERKWSQHKVLVSEMTRIIHEYGLNEAAMAETMRRGMGVDRREESGTQWTLVNNDSVLECGSMESDSIGLVVTSIPFSNQYEYSPNYADFGHTDHADHFWNQMDFLIPHLLRILQPGRIAAIHVKDRICPGGVNGFGFQTVQPFSDECIQAFIRHGFAFIARKTIVTDVVRENAQTYRLGWSEQCKDGSRMGNGMPEYLLVFRKAPTDRSNGYADEPVVKEKGSYSRGRWQFDAHGFTRSSGNRLLMPDDLRGMTHQQLFQAFKSHSETDVYNFEHDVRIAEAADELDMLPSAFMLLQPRSWSDEVWTDVTRMLTLNSPGVGGVNSEKHICPLQFDIADRAITQYSNEGDIVFDPFAGIGTVPLRAVVLDRIGVGCELSPVYFDHSVRNLRANDERVETPSLFDLVEVSS